MQISAVAGAGLVTSILTAAGNTLIHWFTGFNLFSLSFFVIVPAGALLCGFAAAYGYYFAAKFFHIRPNKVLLFQMIVIAAITQFLIYWLEYQTLVVEGIHVADFMPFGQYMDISLTTQHLKFGRGAHIDGGAVGEGGYWLAALDFLGFLVGGGFVYFTLLQEPTCEPCNKYLKPLVKKKDSFGDQESFAEYYDNEFAHPIGSAEFARHVGTEYSAGKAEKGTINMETRVLECPDCGSQAVSETIQVFNGRDWKEIGELRRFVEMPKGTDVRRAYSGLE
ncbi:hypothetical protein [Sphingobium sp. CECT 9361]|uniref:hypothetical protein n=1 Tax=Sphingobium sp. CECT 9361 TaxID=2845384 RepID=UPI001E64FCC1|nr:hypothetical protein [Sphingobium sp. CECT 9361]